MPDSEPLLCVFVAQLHPGHRMGQVLLLPPKRGDVEQLIGGFSMSRPRSYPSRGEPFVERDGGMIGPVRLHLRPRRRAGEVKSVDALAPVHEAQLLTYLRLSGRRLGFLINFNVVLLKQGIKRMIL
jgi:hypothetical protein